MKSRSVLVLIFAVLSVVFFLLLIFLRSPFPIYKLISFQDVFDLLTPIVLLPLYWLLFKATSKDKSTQAEEIVFMIFAAVWALGHGMHLAANSIDNLIENLSKTHVIDITASTIYQLTYFLDEHLSHYLWHIGVLGLAGIIIYREWRRPADKPTVWWITILAGVLYGFTYFCIFLEGQTVPLGFPAAAIFLTFTLIWGRKQLPEKPILAFFFISALVAFVLFTGWGLYWGGFPQFSDVGLI